MNKRADDRQAEKETVNALLMVLQHGPERLFTKVPAELDLPAAHVADLDGLSMLVILRKNRSVFSGYFR